MDASLTTSREDVCKRALKIIVGWLAASDTARLPIILSQSSSLDTVSKRRFILFE